MGIIYLSYGVKKPPLMISSWMIINWDSPDAINLRRVGIVRGEPNLTCGDGLSLKDGL